MGRNQKKYIVAESSSSDKIPIIKVKTRTEKSLSWRSKLKKIKSNARKKSQGIYPGKLFGIALFELSTEEEVIPRPIKQILLEIFRKGLGIVGIFRKSGLALAVKQLRDDLDAGISVEFKDQNINVLAAVLKEFFRSLPEGLFCRQYFGEVCNVNRITDSREKINEVRRLVEQLPEANQNLILHFFCLLHHINRFSDHNNMNSHNLSICVSPSIVKPPKDTSIRVQYEQTPNSVDVVTFMIENYLAIFSVDNEYLLGTEADVECDERLWPSPVNKHSHSLKSDSESSSGPSSTCVNIFSPSTVDCVSSENVLKKFSSMQVTTADSEAAIALKYDSPSRHSLAFNVFSQFPNKFKLP